MQNYSVLAKYYDRFTQNDCDYESWSQYLCTVAKNHGAHTIVDVACGTGKMTALLSNAGYKLIGVDKSAEMLQLASEKCRALLVQQDMLALRLPSPADMAVVVNDGVNYVKPTELVSFFTNLAQNIRDGAPLVFDVSSPYKLQTVLSNNVFFVDDDDVTLLWNNKFSGNALTMQLTLFERSDKATATPIYTRQDEHHTQYLHTPESITQALNVAGFNVVELTAEYGKPFDSTALRHTYYAVYKGI